MQSMKRMIVLAAICSCVLIVAFMQDRSAIKQDAPIINGERYIVVVIPSYNNSRWYKLNLGNLFAQNYTNYHVIYIDDCSDDNTYELVKKFVADCRQDYRVTLIRNPERQGALYNIYHAIHSCPDKAIILTLDGDDWLKGRDVLSTINQAYSNSNVWLTYGQFEEYPRGNLGICHPMPDYIVQSKSYRKQEWFTSHLRTFYAGLFKRVKKEDMMQDGKFYTVTWDQAFLFPMLEMANGHFLFIDKILYVYNQANPLNDFKQHLRKQLLTEREIRRKEQYAPLDPAAVDFCVA